MIISTKQAKDFRLGLWGTLCLGVVVLLLLGAAVYVVRADGVKLLPVADTYVASGRSTQNFASDRTFWVGYDQAGGYQIEQSLLKFDASAIQAGSKITSAKLGLYLSGTTKNDTSMTIKAYRIRSDWPAGITWDGLSSLAVDPEPVASAVVPATLGWYSWDLTAALQAWSDNRDTSNFSLMLRSDVTSGQHERGFWSKDCSTGDCGDPPGNRPYLEIVYALPTPTPTATATSTPSPTHTPTPTPATPRLNATLSQKRQSGNRLQYEILVQNVSGKPAYQVNITNLTPGGVGVSQVLDGGRWYAGPPSQVVWQPGALASGATFLARYVVQLSGTSALGEQVGAAILAEEIVATAPGPPMAEQGMVFGGVDLPGAIEMTPSGTEYSFDTPTPTRTPTRTPSPTSTPTRTMTPTRTPTPSLTAPDTRAPDVLIYNQGANVTWFDEDSMGYSTRSNALFWTNVMQVWLPVVMRSVR